MSGHVVRTGNISADIDFKENIKEFECPICLEHILGAAILLGLLVYVLLPLFDELRELSLFHLQKVHSSTRSFYAIIAVDFIHFSRAIRRADKTRK